MVDPTRPDITVAVVPREKFSYSAATLDALLSHTTLPFELVYIDGGSPRGISEHIQRRLRDRPNTRILRFDHFLAPFRSRNAAIQATDDASKYLVILDNDIMVRPGWLEALHRCAEEEQAGAVVPLVLIGSPTSDVIHHAGGDTGILRQDGKTELFHRQHLEDYRASDVEDQLKRQPTRLVEDHCIFARTALWKSLRRLDDRVPLMTSVPDISFRFQESQAKLMVEPAARVTYLWGDDVPLEPDDLPFWYLAWSEKWSRHYMRRMANEYGLSESRDEDRHVVWWMGNHRRSPISSVLTGSRRFFERLRLPFVGKVVAKAEEKLEDVVALMIAEAVRHTNAGGDTACPPLLARYPQLPRQRLTASPPQSSIG